MLRSERLATPETAIQCKSRALAASRFPEKQRKAGRIGAARLREKRSDRLAAARPNRTRPGVRCALCAVE